MTSRYNNGKIYSIRSNQTDQIYIGSTCGLLHKRLYQHRFDYKNYKVGSKKLSSFEIIKFPDHYIELLELFPCGSRPELCKREGELMRQHNCVNKYIAGRNQKQHYIDNIESIKIKQKQYRTDNTESLKNYRDQYRTDNVESLKIIQKELYICECWGELRISGKSRHLKTQKHIFYQNLSDFILS
jgi:hypothetical protein